MKWAQIFSSLSIRNRLVLGFSAITFILFLAVMITVDKINHTKNITQDIIQTKLPLYDELIELHREIFLVQAALRGWVLTHHSPLKSEFYHGWKNIENSILVIDRLSSRWATENDRKSWQDIKAILLQLKTSQLKTLNANTDKESINVLIQENIPVANKLMDLLDGPISFNGHRSGGLFGKQDEQFHNGSKAIIEDMNSLELTQYFLLIIGIVSAFLISYFTIKSIMYYFNRFREYAHKISSGDLTQRLSMSSKTEVGQLAEDFNAMADSLTAITIQITETSHNMVNTLEEVKRSVEMQSSGAVEQAASVNEITASIAEIEKSSEQTMKKAKMLGNVAEQTREKGQQGLDAVEASIQGMKTIGEKVQSIAHTILEFSNKTQQIGEITAVVNNLAQQSKMLALNASIEAAKAGEAGKGFGVVAAEVKNLAEQSEQSTIQVHKILEDIRHATEKAVMATEEGIKGVEQGTSLVGKTGEIVRSLTDVIHETTMASQHIETAISQENVGIEQITAGMNEINQVTSTFVESVQQTKDAIEHLNTTASNLKHQIDIYKI